jgi:hypothetical protein
MQSMGKRRDPMAGKTSYGLPSLTRRYTYNTTGVNGSVVGNDWDLYYAGSGIIAEALEEETPTVGYNRWWDFDQIQGCLCDEGYSGPDCSLWTCPTGDDPLTGTNDAVAAGAAYQFNELQNITCNATGGSFTVTFRRHTSEPILYDDDVKQITAKIGAMPSIGGVSVVMQYWGGQACTSSHDRGLGKTGAAFTVEFLQVKAFTK